MVICRKVGRQKLQHICKHHKLTHLVKEIGKESKTQNKVKIMQLMMKRKAADLFV